MQKGCSSLLTDNMKFPPVVVIQFSNCVNTLLLCLHTFIMTAQNIWSLVNRTKATLDTEHHQFLSQVYTVLWKHFASSLLAHKMFQKIAEKGNNTTLQLMVHSCVHHRTTWISIDNWKGCNRHEMKWLHRHCLLIKCSKR